MEGGRVGERLGKKVGEIRGRIGSWREKGEREGRLGLIHKSTGDYKQRKRKGQERRERNS